MPHRAFRILTAAALLAAPAWAEAPTPPFEAQVSRAEANVRAGSSVHDDVLATLPRDSRVRVLGEHAGWYRIGLPREARCYIAAPYVDAAGVVTGEHINVRAGAGRQFAILGQAQRGEQVRVLERLEGWLRVEPTAQCSGWIRADLVAPVPAVAAAPETPASELEATTAAEMTAAAAPIATELPPTATGVLESARGFRRPAKHRLTHAGRTLFYVRSHTLDLSPYKHQRIAVWGTMDADIRAPHPVVTVQRVERID